MSSLRQSPESSATTLGRFARSRSVQVVAATVAAGLVVGVAATAGGSAAGAASKQLSNSSGRFLSGEIGGTNLDTVASIDGESASFPDSPGANANSLNASVLNGAIKLPLGSSGLQLPSPGGIQLGAVAQYAKANKDGSALGASGAVDSNGGIGVGGSDGVPTGGATVDLSGLPGASAVTSVVGNVKLAIGAVSARAQQVKIGDTIADPAATCVNTPYSRVSDKDQAARYNVAGLSIQATSPALATLGQTLTTTLGTALSTLGTALNGLNTAGLPISITGIPTAADLAKDLSVSLAGGSITASLVDGSLKIDVAALLKFLGLDLNKLCPNTSLLKYVAQALTGLPAALGDLINGITTKLTTALGQVTVTIGGVPLSASVLGTTINPVITMVTSTLGDALKTVNLSALQPLIDILTSSLLNIVVNGQTETDGVLTETALQLNVISGGGTLALPTGTGLTPAALTRSSVRTAMTPGITAANAEIKQDQAGHPNKSTAKLSSKLKSAAVSSKATRSLAAPSATANAATDPAIGLNLARASVGPNAAAATPTPTPTTSVPTTSVPTGVPAGQGGGGNAPTIPLVLVLLSLAMAAGGVVTYRLRGHRATH